MPAKARRGIGRLLLALDQRRGKTYYGLADTVANAATNPLRNSGQNWIGSRSAMRRPTPSGSLQVPAAGAICSTDTGIEWRNHGGFVWTPRLSSRHPPGGPRVLLDGHGLPRHQAATRATSACPARPRPPAPGPSSRLSRAERGHGVVRGRGGGDRRLPRWSWRTRTAPTPDLHYSENDGLGGGRLSRCPRRWSPSRDSRTTTAPGSRCRSSRPTLGAARTSSRGRRSRFPRAESIRALRGVLCAGGAWLLYLARGLPQVPLRSTRPPARGAPTPPNALCGTRVGCAAGRSPSPPRPTGRCSPGTRHRHGTSHDAPRQAPRTRS